MRPKVFLVVLAAAGALLTQGCTSGEEVTQQFLIGVVSDPSGTALSAAEVEAAPSASTAVSGPDGAYSLELPAGTYTLKVSRAGFLPAQKTDVTLAAGATVIVDLTLLPERTAGALAGTVQQAAGGAPVQGAVVTTEPAAATVATGADGRFLLEDLPAGTYALTVEAEGFSPARADGLVVTAGQTTEKELQLVALATFDSTCQECHFSKELLVADLTVDPPPVSGEVESEGEG